MVIRRQEGETTMVNGIKNAAYDKMEQKYTMSRGEY